MPFPIKPNIRIDAACDGPAVDIRAREVNNDVTDLAAFIESWQPKRIEVSRSGRMALLPQQDVIRVYLEKRKLYIAAVDGVYAMNMSLSDLEAALSDTLFLRISRNEIINVHKIKSLDFNVRGTVRIELVNGDITYCSRNYVSDIAALKGAIR